MRHLINTAFVRGRRMILNWESSYLAANPDVSNFRFRPLVHFAVFGFRERRIAQISFQRRSTGFERKSGMLGFSEARKTILLVAHENNSSFFGGEHSLIDMLQAFSKIGNVVTIIPPGNQSYTNQVLQYASRIIEMPVAWWRDSDTRSVASSIQVIVEEGPDVLVVNTSAPKSFIQAGKMTATPTVVVVREAIGEDSALNTLYGEDSEKVFETLGKYADVLVANSHYTASLLANKQLSATVIRNRVQEPEHHSWVRENNVRTVGIVSSNIPKKGISDFVHAAAMMQSRDQEIAFKIFGPLTKHAKTSLRLARALGVSNIEVTGFEPDTNKIYRELDVLVSTSKFPETFGRTIAEAIVRGVPVVAYDRGAVGELIDDEANGSLVEADNIEQVASRSLAWVEKSRQQRIVFSRTSHLSESLTDLERYQEDWSRLVENVVPAFNKDSGGPSTQPGVCAIVPLYNGEQFIERRLRTIINQSKPVDEIVIVDDCSSDAGPEIAERILANSNVPFQIYRAESNLGVFESWAKGLELTAQKLVWVAEQDDFCSDEFIEECLPYFANSETAIVHCASNTVDTIGEVISPRNENHFKNVAPQIWSRDHFLSNFSYLGFWKKGFNPIPNASAAIFDRTSLSTEELRKFNFAGDMYVYMCVSKGRKIQYVSRVMNSFTRSPHGATRKNIKTHRYIAEVNKLMEFALQLDHLSPNTLVFSSNPNSIDGGSERIWWDAKKSIATSDFQVLYSCATPNESLITDLDHKVGLLRYEPKLAERIEHMGIHPAMTIVNQGHLYEGIEAMQALARRNLPYVVVNQLVKPKTDIEPISVEKNKLIGKLLEDAEFVSFTSESSKTMAEELLGRDLKNSYIHRNPIEDFSDRALPNYRDVGQDIAIPSRVLFMHKGQDLILEALMDTELQNTDLRLHFFGVGKDLHESISRVTELDLTAHFRFHPRVSTLDKIWKMCGAFIMPSRMEGMPLAALSGASAGAIPIVSEAGGLAEFRDNISCIPIDSLTGGGLTESLRKYAKMKDREKEVMSAQVRADYNLFIKNMKTVDAYSLASN